MVLQIIALVIFGYLLGSIPTGYWLVKVLKGIDLRTIGSGSTGTTNVLRAAGKFPALLVLIVDIAKGYVPALLGVSYEHHHIHHHITSLHLVAPLTATASLIGHSKSIFLGFKGGKSAATALGTLFAFNIPVTLALFILWAILVATIRIVSVASIITAILSSPSMFLGHTPLSYVIYVLFGSMIVIYLHQANIQRILAGTEPKIGEKSKT